MKPTDETALAAGEPPHRRNETSISAEPIDTKPSRKSQKCPQCGLVNPPEAQRCDCGWDFMSQRQEKTYLEPNHQEPPHVRAILGAVGVICIAVYVMFRLIQFLLTVGNL